MNIKIERFSEEDAKSICLWRYKDQYSVYNLPEWNISKVKNLGITNSNLRNKQFKSLYNNDTLIGYFRIIEKENFLSLGIGLNPKYCGLGLSNIIIPKIIEFAKIKYQKKIIRLIVRDFNQRAIKAYEKFGFKSEGYILSETPNGTANCRIMVKLLE